MPLTVDIRSPQGLVTAHLLLEDEGDGHWVEGPGTPLTEEDLRLLRSFDWDRCAVAGGRGDGDLRLIAPESLGPPSPGPETPAGTEAPPQNERPPCNS
jgi:hypothetical protein